MSPLSHKDDLEVGEMILDRRPDDGPPFLDQGDLKTWLRMGVRPRNLGRKHSVQLV